MDYYDLEVASLKRRLPLVAISPKMSIASFNLLGDGELVEAISARLESEIKQYPFDFLVGPEVKVLPLLHSLSLRLNRPRYIVLRKSIMGYMVRPVTNRFRPTLVLNGPDADFVKGKKVVIVDDVVTTGETIASVARLMKTAGAKVAAIFTVLKQGEEKVELETPFFYLTKLPLFTNSKN